MLCRKNDNKQLQYNVVLFLSAVDRTGVVVISVS